ncbi:HAD family hydrolase [Roseibium sp.]|uniref:HAD family hydrolase n=1 Tax=Roseibium sp. TaxID=1936156 RepID=UPI003D104E00
MQDLIAGAEALIFDFDGTLVASPELYAAGWRQAFSKAGYSLEPGWYHRRAGLSEQVLLDEFSQQFGAAFNRRQVTDDMRQGVIDRLHMLREISQVAAIARQNAGAKPMAVASSGPQAIVVPSLRTVNLLSCFDAIVTIEDVAQAKPAPDLFLKAAYVLGVEPENCLVFEDSPQGILAAENAGMRCLDISQLV